MRLQNTLYSHISLYAAVQRKRFVSAKGALDAVREWVTVDKLSSRDPRIFYVRQVDSDLRENHFYKFLITEYKKPDGSIPDGPIPPPTAPLV